MTHILIASDSKSVQDEVSSSISSGVEVTTLFSGRSVLQTLEKFAGEKNRVDLVILDSQISSMGGFAVASDIKNEITGGRLAPVKTLLLMDRQADTYLARTTGFDGVVVKPLDSMKLEVAIKTILAGGKSY